MRQGLRALAAGALGLAVSLVAACGSSSGLLSSSDANNLSNQIEKVSADVSNDNCAAVPGDLGSLEQAFSNLPSSLNSTLRANLEQGFDKVKALALEKCPSASTTATTATTTTSTAKTQTTPPPTTTTSTTATQTTTTPPTTTATPPSNTGTTSTGPASGGTGLGGSGGSGAGGGNGDGNGNGEHGG